MLFWGLVIIIVIMLTLNFFLRLMTVAKRSDERIEKLMREKDIENNTYNC